MDTSHKDDRTGLPNLIYIRNCPFVAEKFERQEFENAINYQSKDGDIILCSYPKTGATWTHYIIWAILNKAEFLPALQDMILGYFPYIKMAGVEVVNALTPPRTYRHHFPYNLIKVNKNAKCIYIHRNPADTVISYYHYSLVLYQRTFTFDEFFESFISGQLSSGDFFDHVLSYDLHKDEPHLLILSYEDLKKDTRGQILKLARFLGEEYYKTLIEDEARLQKILEITSFDHMKEHVDGTFSPAEKVSVKKHKFVFRKGIIGDGENALSSEQKMRLHQKMLNKMEGTRYVPLWSSK